MTATCVIRGKGEGWVYDPEQGKDVPAPGPVIYDGPVRWQRDRDAVVVVAGTQDVKVRKAVGAVPWHVTDVVEGMTLEVTSSDDPGLLGVFTITEVEASSFATARRLHGQRP